MRRYFNESGATIDVNSGDRASLPHWRSLEVSNGKSTLVIYPDGSALIVDYKTDRDTSRESMLAAHASQMQSYRALISAALSIPPERVAVKLLAVRDGSVYSL